MIAVIFEVEPSKDGRAEYLKLAAQLWTTLEKMDGFISVERFQSMSDPEKLLSLSFWQDEQSAIAWREHPEHRMTQAAGRAGVFDNYRLRVTMVIRDYGLHERDEAPQYHPPIKRSTRSCPIRPPADQK